MASNHLGAPPERLEQTRDVRQYQISPKFLFACVAGYFLLQLLSRVLVSDTANLDEAEQLILTQRLQWGYASQPPLYTWLQSFFFVIFGINIFALALLKNALLFTTYAFSYLTAKQITGERTSGLLALLGLLFLPQIVWESQRDLTHSVLTTTLAASTVFCSIKIFQTRKTLYYLLIGLCAAAGILSKYNYAVFFLALCVSALSLRKIRPAVLDRRILFSVALFLLLTLPHFHWVWSHHEAAFAQAEKLHTSTAANFLTLHGKGLASLIIAIAGYVLPLALIYLAFCKWKARLFIPQTDTEKLFVRTMLLGLFFCLIAVFSFNARFKDRWMQPLLFLIPIYFSLRFWQALDASKIRKFVIVSRGVALVVLVLLPLDTLSGSFRKKQTRLNAPYSALLKQLEPHFHPRLIVAENRLVGGNLRLKFPNSDVLVPELARFPFANDTPGLIVWGVTDKTNMSPQFARFVSKVLQADISQAKAGYLESPYKYSNEQLMRLGFVALPPATPQDWNR